MTAHINPGFVLTTEPVTLADVRDSGATVIHHLTLFNPNASAVSFVIRLAWTDEAGNERQVRLYDDEIAALHADPNPYEIGTLGGAVLVLRAEVSQIDMRYEIVLDATPTNAVEYTVHFAREG